MTPPCFCIYERQPDGTWARRLTRNCQRHGVTGHWKIVT